MVDPENTGDEQFIEMEIVPGMRIRTISGEGYRTGSVLEVVADDYLRVQLDGQALPIVVPSQNCIYMPDGEAAREGEGEQHIADAIVGMSLSSHQVRVAASQHYRQQAEITHLEHKVEMAPGSLAAIKAVLKPVHVRTEEIVLSELEGVMEVARGRVLDMSAASIEARHRHYLDLKNNLNVTITNEDEATEQLDALYSKLVVELDKIQRGKKASAAAVMERLRADASLVVPQTMPTASVLPAAAAVQDEEAKKRRQRELRAERNRRLRKRIKAQLEQMGGAQMDEEPGAEGDKKDD